MNILALNSCSHAGEMKSGVKRPTAVESLKISAQKAGVTFEFRSFFIEVSVSVDEGHKDFQQL